MKRKIMILLITIMAVGSIFTGCSKEKENTEQASNTEVIDGDKVPDKTPDKTSDSKGEDKQMVTGDWKTLNKFKVENIIEESTNAGVYGLKYDSKEKTENIVKYYSGLMKETPNYFIQEMPGGVGAMIKGTLDGNKITISITYNKDSDITLVESYSVAE